MWPWFNSNPLMSMQDNSKKQLSASEAGDDLIHGDEAEKLSKSEKPNNGSGRCTLEIIILLGYGADTPKKDFTPLLETTEVKE